MEKAIEIKAAKKRRAKMLAEFTRTRCTKIKLAKKYGISPQRMGQLLGLAQKDLN